MFRVDLFFLGRIDKNIQRKKLTTNYFRNFFQKFFRRTDGNFSDKRRMDGNFSNGRTKMFRPTGRKLGGLRHSQTPLQSVSQTIHVDLVVTIQNLAESSKSELSSVTSGHFKVYKKGAKYQKSQLVRTPIT